MGTNGQAAEHKRTIVSLVPSITQSLYYLNAQNMLVGRTSYCKAAEGDGVAVVASVVKPNMEKLISLKPDLVLATGLLSPNDRATLNKFGIQVELFTSPTSFEDICSQFIRLGQLVGREEKATRLVTDAKNRVQAIMQELSQQKHKPKIFMQAGANPILSVFPNTFMDDYITYAGGVNIAGSLTSGAMSREFVVASDPEYIFVVTMGMVGEKEVEQWKQFTTMKAVASKHVFVLNADIACEPTPVTFVKTLESMRAFMVGR